MKVLFVAPHYACKPSSGGGQRTQLLFEALCDSPTIDQIDVLVLDEQGRSAKEFFPDSIDVKTIVPKSRADLGIWRILKKVVGKRADALATAFGLRKKQYSATMIHKKDIPNWRAYDAIVGRYLRPLSMVGGFDSALPIFLDIDDRDDVLYSSRLNTPNIGFTKKLLLQWHLYQIKSIQKTLLPLCRHAWVASKDDLNILPLKRESVLPNIPFTSGDQVNISNLVDHKTILFVGACGHRINREGVLWFLKHCWADIKQAVPDASIRIVGSGGWESYAKEYSHLKGVTFVGFCESLESEYESCRFTVVPLFEGGGTKIKVLESYLFNRGALGTAHAYVGYNELAQSAPMFQTESSESFSSSAISLLQSPIEHIQREVDAGRELVIKKFSRQAFNDAVATGLN